LICAEQASSLGVKYNQHDAPPALDRLIKQFCFFWHSTQHAYALVKPEMEMGLLAVQAENSAILLPPLAVLARLLEEHAA
jgi:hypothetical protein